MKITLDPYGEQHAAAAKAEIENGYRSAFIDREGTVYVQTSSNEAYDYDQAIPNYDDLTEFAREADAALRAAVADQ